ncbi:MAG: hypothetical protein ACI4A8_00480 [Muribaculaceae bacterium]
MKSFRHNITIIAAYTLMLTSLCSCFTGVESTRKITDKDVRNSGAQIKEGPETAIDSLCTAPFNQWYRGKQFYINDNQFRLVLQTDNLPADTTNLEGKVVKFDGARNENMLGLGYTVTLTFFDAEGNRYNYNTGKSERDIADMNHRLTVPFLTDCDMIIHADSLLRNKEAYITTSGWYNVNNELIQGYKYERVKILQVEPGNKVYSFRIRFEYKGKMAFSFIATLENSVSSRLFSNTFSYNDPHKQYPDISDENWELIKRCQIKADMTREECRLSIGAPQDVTKRPTYNGLQEYWLYENGVYLIFEDGLLTRFRR